MKHRESTTIIAFPHFVVLGLNDGLQRGVRTRNPRALYKYRIACQRSSYRDNFFHKRLFFFPVFRSATPFGRLIIISDVHDAAWVSIVFIIPSVRMYKNRYIFTSGMNSGKA